MSESSKSDHDLDPKCPGITCIEKCNSRGQLLFMKDQKSLIKQSQLILIKQSLIFAPL